MPRTSSRRGVKLTEEQKQNLARGRQNAIALRAKAHEFFQSNEKLVLSPKFWASMPEALREGIVNAITKAKNKKLERDIKNLENLIEQKRQEIKGR